MTQPANPPTNPDNYVNVLSGLTNEDHRPLVQLQSSGLVLLTPKEAVDLANLITAAAHSVSHDEFFYRFMLDELKIPDERMEGLMLGYAASKLERFGKP